MMNEINKKFWTKVYLLKGQYFDYIPKEYENEFLDTDGLYYITLDDDSLVNQGYARYYANGRAIFTDKFIDEIINGDKNG